MTKAILLSVRPEHALNILYKIKTLEIRKRIPKGFKGWVYMYITKAKHKNDYLFGELDLSDDYKNIAYGDKWLALTRDKLNGKVVARFWFDEYDVIKGDFEPDYFGEIDGELYIGNLYDLSPTITKETIAKMACIDEIELID